MHHHLLTRVPDKLDLNNWNYGSWEFFFVQLCESYDVDKFIRPPTTDATGLRSSKPLTLEELKVDKIVLSWILFTLSDSLRARLVVTRPKSAMEAWNLIDEIIKDNKRSRTNALEAKLSSIKLRNQSMESYFQKIDSLVNILTSLDARINEEDVVHYALEGLPDTYNLVYGYMHWKDTFPDLKMVRSLLITEEMRLKYRALDLPVDSSSPMVLMANSETCRYVHDASARLGTNLNGSTRGRGNSDNTTNDLLQKLLHQLSSMNCNSTVPISNSSNTMPVTFNASLRAHFGPTTGPQLGAPLGFSYPAHPSHNGSSITTPAGPSSGSSITTPTAGSTQPTGQPTILPHAFSTETLRDSNNGDWNMDTGASSHLNASSTCLSNVFNTCLYPSVSVGDGYSIPVTNTGHSILPTSHGDLHLRNVLITPSIVKKLISVRQFVRDNNCTIEFDAFGFSVKDFTTRRVLL
ncbi:ribonuclease H-like domain-containing protein [Tanacetum coccineum]